jgi:hypothetical protein
MAAVAHIPLIKRFGISPAGLNATADPEIQVFYDHVHAKQEADLTANLTICSQLAQLNLWGKIDPTIGFDYVPLMEPDGEALARTFKTKADAGTQYIAASVITNEEERDRLKNDPTSGYNDLSGDAPEPEPEDGGDGEPGEAGEGDGGGDST